MGDYVATCVICREQYVGQSKNKFSKRWWSHRDVDNKLDNTDDSDLTALSRFYSVFHGVIYKLPIYESYSVSIVE